MPAPSVSPRLVLYAVYAPASVSQGAESVLPRAFVRV